MSLTFDNWIKQVNRTVGQAKQRARMKCHFTTTTASGPTPYAAQ